MKRAIVTGIVCALLGAGVAWATQTWRDNESMGGFSLTDPTHAGGGPLCVQYDNTGKLTSAGTPCGAGLGGSAGVSSVTGTAPIASSGGAAPNISISLPSGQVAFGTGTNVSSNSQFTYSASLDQIQNVFTKATGQNGIKITNSSSGSGAFVDVALANDLGDPSRSDVFYASSTYATSDCGPSHLCLVTAAGGSSYIDFSPNNVKSLTIQPSRIELPTSDGSSIAIELDQGAAQVINKVGGPLYIGTGDANFVGFFTNNSGVQFKITSAGTIQAASLAAGGITKAAVTTGEFGIASPGTDYQAPLVACTDYVSLSCVSGTTDLGGTNATPTVIGFENTAAMRGDIVATEIVAPGTPAAGKLACYGDSSSLNWACKDETGERQTRRPNDDGDSRVSFFTAVSDSGQFSRAQPSYSDISGSPPDQEPGLG